MYIAAPYFDIRNQKLQLTRPSQNNVSGWTGRRTALTEPWYSKWSGSVELSPLVGEEQIRLIRSFLIKCKGQINTFRVLVTCEAQNNNSNVVVLSSAVVNSNTMQISGYGTPLKEGQYFTVNGQLCCCTADQSGSTLTFEPRLRQQANAGTTVVTQRPYVLVCLTGATVGYEVSPGRVHGVSFDFEEAILEADGTAPTEVAPTNSAAPTITGGAYVGGPLTAAPGTWNGSPDTFTYQWFADGVAVSLENSANAYTPTLADAGKVITVKVRAASIYGASAQAASAGTAAVDGYAIFADFKNATYRQAGATLGGLNSAAGYSFSRTGVQGSVLTNGTVALYATGVAAIDTAGYHAHRAITNLMPRSQDWTTGWANDGSTTVTANNTNGPDGTATADKIADANLGTSGPFYTYQSVNFSGSGVKSFTVIVKAGTNVSWIRLYAQNYNVSGQAAGATAGCYFDIANGAVGTAANGATGYIRALANGWYVCTIEFTLDGTDTAGFCVIQAANGDGATTFTRNGTNFFYAWQAQAMDAGKSMGAEIPIIPTTTATASITDNVLTIGDAAPMGDFVVWGIVNVLASPNGYVFSLADVGGSDQVPLQLTTSLAVPLFNIGGVAQALPPSIPLVAGASGGRIVGMLRRRNGVYSIAAKKADGTIVIGADASSPAGVPAFTKILPGTYWNGAFGIDGRVEGVYHRNGTFSDADISAILTAA